MPSPAHLEVQSAAPRERPWLFNVLIAPDAVISLGLIGGALSFLLRKQGVNPATAASIVGERYVDPILFGAGRGFMLEG